MSILRLLQVLINGQAHNPAPKHDLRKQPQHKNFSMMNNMNMNYKLLLLVVILASLFMFVMLCFYMSGISAVESGNYYYQLESII